MLPVDPNSWVVYGPLGLACAGLLWLVGKLTDLRDKDRQEFEKRIVELTNAHKVEIAAERALNAKLQDDRLTDQKTLIPLAHSVIAALEKKASE